jgi:hypothetical protein
MEELLSPLMDAVLNCVCTRIATDGRPACMCCQVVSEVAPPMTRCECDCDGPGQGWGWIRFDRADFQGNDLPSSCLVGVWRATFQVGIYRCITDSLGDCATMAVDAANTHKDIGSITLALQCCAAFQGKKWDIENVEIIGPSGQCVGVAVTFFVDLTTLGTA